MPIENTAARDALLHLAGAWGDSDRYITEMESAGQSQLIHSDRLPTESRNSDAEFTALGFTFGEPDTHDPMFRPATLPQGWTRQGSDHAMWSYLLDEKGRQRVAIFYKAAFYDRSAHMSLIHPASVLSDMLYADDDPTGLPIDDLLTPEIARKHLNQGRTAAVEQVDMYQRAHQMGRASGSDVDEAHDRVRRIDLMIGMLP